MTAKKPWWFPERTDAAWLKRIRKGYPEDAHQSDEWLRDYYADGWRYVTTWDHVGDARAEHEELADAFLAILSRCVFEWTDGHRYCLLCPTTWPGRAPTRIDWPEWHSGDHHQDGCPFKEAP